MKQNKITQYFSNAFEEFHRITWPTRDTSIKLTLIVIIVTIATMVFSGVMDLIFQKAFEFIITKLQIK